MIKPTNNLIFYHICFPYEYGVSPWISFEIVLWIGNCKSFTLTSLNITFEHCWINFQFS